MVSSRPSFSSSVIGSTSSNVRPDAIPSAVTFKEAKFTFTPFTTSKDLCYNVQRKVAYDVMQALYHIWIETAKRILHG